MHFELETCACEAQAIGDERITRCCDQMEVEMSKVTSLSVIFPVYNEEANITKTVLSTLRLIPSYAKEWEIIIVNDGSHDGTRDITEWLSQISYSVRTVHHPINRGYGAALRSGISQATYDLIFFCDPDLQFNFEEITLLLRWIDEYDIVVGYRMKRKDPLYRRLNAWGWNQLVRREFGLKVRDIDCAFKLFRNKVFNKIKIEAVGAMVNTEILVQAQKYGFRIKEVPVNHYPRLYGEQSGANPRVILKAFVELIRLSRKLKEINPWDQQEGVEEQKHH